MASMGSDHLKAEKLRKGNTKTSVNKQWWQTVHVVGGGYIEQKR